MVRIVSVHYYTNDLGAGRGAYVLQYHGVAEILGWNTWSCELEKRRLLSLFNPGGGVLCKEYWEHHSGGNSSVEMPPCSNFLTEFEILTLFSVPRIFKY